MPPPPGGGGNLKYVIIGVLLLAATAGLWLLIRAGTEEPTPAEPENTEIDKPERSTALGQDDLLLDAEEPDAAEQEVVEEKPARRRRPRRSAWECDGEIDAANVRGVVAKFRPQVRTCYERRLKVNSILQGSMKLRVKVGANGSVVATQVGGSLRDPEVFSCVRELARQWKFPAPGRGDCVVIDIPFNFTPQN